MIDRDLQAAHPDEPWKWQKDWASGRIRCQSGGLTIGVWVMALLWNGFIWPLTIYLWDVPGKQLMVKVLLIFCVAGLFLLFWAVKSALVWFRFGSSFFEMAHNPGVIGGTLEGRIQTRLKQRPQAPIQLTLSCIHHTVTRFKGSDGRRSSHINNDTKWQGGRQVTGDQLVPGPGGLAIPVRLYVPEGLPNTDARDPDDQFIWSLGAAGDLPGVDYGAEFTVPVFTTEESRPDLTQERADDIAEQEGALAQPVDRGKSWQPPVVVRPTASGGIRYDFRLPITLKMTIWLTVLAFAISAGSALLMLWLGEAWPFALIPGALGAVLLLASAVAWTFKSRVVIEKNMIVVRKSVLWIPRFWRVSFSDVKAVRLKREVIEGLKQEERDWEIKIERRSGMKEVDLGASIPNREDAKRIVDEIENLVY